MMWSRFGLYDYAGKLSACGPAIIGCSIFLCFPNRVTQARALCALLIFTRNLLKPREMILLMHYLNLLVSQLVRFSSDSIKMLIRYREERPAWSKTYRSKRDDNIWRIYRPNL